VSFSDDSGPIAGCEAVQMNLSSPDTATCEASHAHPGSDKVSATYAGDANYAGSTGTLSEIADEAPAITSEDATTFTKGDEGSFTITTSGTPSPTVKESGPLPAGVEFDSATDMLSGTPTESGSYAITFTAANGIGANAVQSFTLTVDAAPVITSEASTTFTKGIAGTFTVTASGNPTPSVSESGALPAGVEFKNGVLSGTPTQTGSFPISFTASNEVGFSAQSFTLTVLSFHVTTKSLPGVKRGVHYSMQLEALGGIPPYKWKVSAGKLPGGLRLSGGGHLAGTLKAKADPSDRPVTFTVTVKDHTKKGHQAASATFTLQVL
jgi:hypothetical protein